MEKIVELTPRFDSAKSFYGKAKVMTKEYDNFTAYILISYTTEVASYEVYKNGFTVCMINGKYSQTTTRHIKEFFKQFDLSDFSLLKLLNDKRIEFIKK